MNKREAGDILWKQKFDEFGLSERFEFICRDWSYDRGRKASVKCRACDNIFNTTSIPDVFKGKIKSIKCPACGIRSDGTFVSGKSPLAKEILSYYNEGHSSRATAKKYGIPYHQVDNIVRDNGGRKRDRLPNNTEALIASHKRANAVQAANAKAKTIEIIEDCGFVYAGNYTGVKGNRRVSIKCKDCGHVFERTVLYVNQGKLSCPNCEKIKRGFQKIVCAAIAKKEAERKAKEREERRKQENPLGLTAYQLEKEKKLDEVFVCKLCGKEYTPRQYVESTGGKSYSNPGYCSIKCGKKHQRDKQKETSKSIRHRAKKYGCKYDSSVTLRRLIARDGLRCGICGGICNPDDHDWTEYFGPTSPTIDHIFPLARGGSHTWDNVQVAHAICNSRKRDTYEAS